jgi:hypothetical protein
MISMAAAAAEGLEAIESLTHVGGERAEIALAAIRAVLLTLKEGFAGTAKPEDVRARIESLQQSFIHSLAENDENALADLRKKFPK